jgi:hypothetical protein
MKKIHIPHLSYTLYICDKKNAKGYAKEYLKKMHACREIIDHKSSKIWIKIPIKPLEFPTLAHEVVHVLQHIAKEKDMVFEKEEEHFAYLMHYILNEVLGYEFI